MKIHIKRMDLFAVLTLTNDAGHRSYIQENHFMKKGDRVMVVANQAIRENKCGMGTLDTYIRTDPKPFGGYHVETWELYFDGDEDGLGTYRCNLLVDDSLATNPELFS